MRKYETVIISDPDLQDQTRTELFDKIGHIIARENGLLLTVDDWGNKKLAYDIKKKSRGHYVCMTYGGTGELVTELERNLRLNDDIMKFMTVLLTRQVTRESLEQEIEAAQAAAEAATEAVESDEAETETTPEADMPSDVSAPTKGDDAEKIEDGTPPDGAPEETPDPDQTTPPEQG